MESEYQHPSEILKKGQKVDAIVLALDPRTGGWLWDLNNWSRTPGRFFAKIQVGDMVHGKVTRQVSFGVFVELQEGIEGLCHVSELAHEHGSGPAKLLEVGSEHEFRILRLSPGDRRSP